MINVVYCAQFHDFSGYGIAAREYLKALDAVVKQNGINLKIYSVIASKASHIPEEYEILLDKYSFNSDKEITDFIQNQYICLWHMPPVMGLTSDDMFKTSSKHSRRLKEIINRSVKNINYLAWETDTLPQNYRDSIEYFNTSEVWVPSSFNCDLVSHAKINNIKINTVSHVVDTSKEYSFEEINIPFNLDNKFIVLSNSQWTERKGFDILIKAFLSEFYNNEDAVLILKTLESQTHNTKQIQEEVLKIQNLLSFKKNDFKCKIIILTGYYTQNQINWLYKKSSILASLTRGEGFGLTLSESVCMKIPVLCPSEGGHTDFLDPKSSYFCEGHWDSCMLGIEPYDHNSKWFETHIHSVKNNLRKAYIDFFNDKSKYHQLTQKALDFINSRKIGYYDIGLKISLLLKDTYSSFVDSNENENNKKYNIKNLLIQSTNIQDKIEILKNSYAGEDCYILNCGPSLNEYSKEYLDNLLQDKLVFSVKQAWERHPEITDFHFFNCCNLPIAKNGFEHYSYINRNKPITIASSNYQEGMRWSRFQKYDLFLNVPVRTEIENEFLCFTKNFDSYLLEKQIPRPCGPGIMLETVIYTAIHLGVKNIFALGWDLSYNNIKDVDNYKHFFGDTKNLFNRGDILDWEIEANRQISKDLYYWLASKGINLYLASTQSSLYEGIPRVKL